MLDIRFIVENAQAVKDAMATRSGTYDVDKVVSSAPDVSGKLTHAEGSYDSKKGKISVSWKAEEGKIKYFARVPKEINLTLDMPENVVAEIERY